MKKFASVAASFVVLAMCVAQPAQAETVLLGCVRKDKTDEPFNARIDFDRRTISIPTAMGEGKSAPAQITEQFITFTFRNIYGHEEQRRLDRVSGVMFYYNTVSKRFEDFFGIVCHRPAF